MKTYFDIGCSSFPASASSTVVVVIDNAVKGQFVGLMVVVLKLDWIIPVAVANCLLQSGLLNVAMEHLFEYV